MYPILHSSSFFFFLAIVFSSLELSTPFRIVKDEAKFRSCSQQFNCGNITNISYPFWGGDRIQDCGRPEYKLECRDSTYTEIEIESTKFTILGIRKMDQTLTVVGTDIMDDGCPDRIPNIRVDDSPFECASNKSKLTYFYDCRDGIIPSKIPPELRCERNSEPFYNGFFQVEPHPRDPSCKSSIPVPILENYTWDLNMTKEVVKKGFDLRYKDVDAGTDCQKCIHSAGQCGYDRTSDEFVCFSCPSSDNNFVGAVDQLFQNCSVPRFCGSQLITFPFYTDEEQKHCGYPGFHLSCNYYNGSNHIPILNLYGDDYIVHEIFYENQSLIVSNAAFSTPNTACFPPIRNVSLPPDFTLASDEINCKVFLLQNCTSSSDLNKYKIGCSAENDTNWVLALPENVEKKVDEASEKCGIESNEVAELPVMEYNSSEINNEEEMREVLSRGFMLNWIASDCTLCNSTGGKCGFDYSFHHFKCFCPDGPHAAKCDRPGSKELGLKLGLVIGLPVIILVLLFLLWRYKQKCSAQKFLSRSICDPYMNLDPEGGSVYLGVHVFSYKDLEEATNNFAGEKELGDGGFGTVYHGKLKDGREVAVKRLYEHNYKRVEQFTNEIEILAHLRHKNLVSLYGCTSRHCRELLLVYEYIPNGTVADHLHGDRAQTSPLSWPVRMSIAIETASALAYLHASDIVHRDVKTNNILLDNFFCVKVADFGLSRLFPNHVTHVSTAPQGTPGYVDPEYHQCYQLTSKSDVYSFGVVLVELISSMPAVDITRHRHEINLSNLAISKIQKRAYNELVDLRLGFDSDGETKRMTIAVAELAFQCLQQDKETRPTMHEVLEELKSIESGNNESENQVKKGFDGVTESVRPPPSPDCDEIGLLKRVIEQQPSPNTVTENWPSSRSSTPNISG